MKNLYKPPIQTAFGGYFARNLRRFCLEQNLTQEEAADRCQCSARGFGNLCRGVSLPTIQTLENVCKCFQCTPNDLLLPPPSRRG